MFNSLKYRRNIVQIRLKGDFRTKYFCLNPSYSAHKLCDKESINCLIKKISVSTILNLFLEFSGKKNHTVIECGKEKKNGKHEAVRPLLWNLLQEQTKEIFHVCTHVGVCGKLNWFRMVSSGVRRRKKD